MKMLLYHSSWDWLIPLWSKLIGELRVVGSLVEEMSGAIMQDDIEKGWNVVCKTIQKYHKKLF